MKNLILLVPSLRDVNVVPFVDFKVFTGLVVPLVIDCIEDDKLAIFVKFDEWYSVSYLTAVLSCSKVKNAGPMCRKCRDFQVKGNSPGGSPDWDCS